MSGEEQYINPIIQAMVHSANLKKDALDRAEKAKQFAVTSKIQQQLADQSAKQIENEHSYHEATIKNATDLMQVHREQAKNESMKNILSIIHGGGNADLFKDPGTTSPIPIQIPGGPQGPTIPQGIGATPPGMVDLPGIGRRPESSLPTPEGLNKLMEAQASAKSRGTAEGALPSHLELLAQQGKQAAQMALANHTAQMNNTLQQGANAERVARINNQAHLAATGLTGEYHLKGIQAMHDIGMGSSFGTDDNSALNIIDNKIGGIENGTVGYGSLSKDEKRGADARASQLGIQLPTDQKAYSKNLDSLDKMQVLIQQARNLANNYSRDTPGGGIIPKLTRGLSGKAISGSDLDSKLKEWKSTAGQLASQFDENNRKTDAEIIRNAIGAFDPAATKQQNLDKINSKIELMDPVIKRSFAGMKSEQVNRILMNRGITEFGGYSTPSSTQKGTENWTRDASGNLVKQ